MYLDRLSTQGGLGVSRQIINTEEGWVYLDKLSTQGELGVSRQVINTGEV